ncbi:hypothetical protein D8674_024666 [Pyrus ussuriensis x Pyrus communis]|uniref:Uncharacterized protein n=1 Tax=Pyrus ussuriensis x Pyrus communis TaxID=2448454 RepID=A0A5N5HH28_9ROSA|nr:hypothetical protein D8674_024666 [Pyrus ussuriensis x Pyrus communis]
MLIVKTQNPATPPRIHPTSVLDPVCGSSSLLTSANDTTGQVAMATNSSIFAPESSQFRYFPTQSVYPNAFKFLLLKSAPRIATVKSGNGLVGVRVWC